jgi:hypothetical protein
VEVSEDGGRTYCQILVQEYNFSPGGATYQHEDQRFNRRQVSQLRLTSFRTRTAPAQRRSRRSTSTLSACISAELRVTFHSARSSCAAALRRKHPAKYRQSGTKGLLTILSPISGFC